LGKEYSKMRGKNARKKASQVFGSHTVKNINLRTEIRTRQMKKRNQKQEAGRRTGLNF